MNYEVIQLNSGTWRIEDGDVRFFLLAGEKEALLIDSGMMVNNARDIAESLTDLPVKLLNTHADRDHVGSNHQFETVYMSLAECVNYQGLGNSLTAVTPVWDGQIIDLGGRPLEIVALPGHTPGSIGVLDIKNRVFITGDPIQDGRIFMFGQNRNLTAYYHSLQRAYSMRERYELIYPSHGSFPVTAELIPELMKGVERVMKGEVPSVPAQFHGMKFSVSDIGVAKLLLDCE